MSQVSAILDARLSQETELLITGNVGCGKTTEALKYCLTQKTGVLFVTNSYKSIQEIFKRIRTEFSEQSKDLLIVEVRGKDKACDRTCHHDRDLMPMSLIPSLKGTFTPEDIPKEYCGYATLNRLAGFADVVFTHYEFLKKNLNLFLSRYNLLVIDEVDQLLRPRDFTLVRYRGYPALHLEREEDGLTQVWADLKSLDLGDSRIQSAFEGIDYLRKILNPPSLEADSSEKTRAENPTLDNRTIEEQGSRFAFREIYGKVEQWNHPVFLDDLKKRFSAISLRDFTRLNSERAYRLEKFREIASDPKGFILKNRQGSPENPAGYTSIVLSSKLADFNELFQRKIYISATPPPNLAQIQTIDLSDRTNYSKNLFIHLDNERVFSLIQALRKKHSIHAITTGTKRLYRYQKKYGGDSIQKFATEEELKIYLDSNRGALIWNYHNSKFARAVNQLSVFDLIIVFNWMPDAETIVSNNPADHRRRALNETYQLTGRSLRGIPYRNKVVIFLEKDPFEEYKEIYVLSKFKSHNRIEDAVKEISNWLETPEHRKKPKLRLKVTKRVINGKEHFYVGGNHVAVDYNEEMRALEGKYLTLEIESLLEALTPKA